MDAAVLARFDASVRSGFERRCIACDKRSNRELAARRKAARAAKNKEK